MRTFVNPKFVTFDRQPFQHWSSGLPLNGYTQMSIMRMCSCERSVAHVFFIIYSVGGIMALAPHASHNKLCRSVWTEAGFYGPKGLWAGYNSLLGKSSPTWYWICVNCCVSYLKELDDTVWVVEVEHLYSLSNSCNSILVSYKKNTGLIIVPTGAAVPRGSLLFPMTSISGLFSE